MWKGGLMLEHMVCNECGAEFDGDLFSEDPSETFVCPLCGTVTRAVPSGSSRRM